jgi:hypothetical protein
MSLKKLMSVLCMLAISVLVFSACENTDDPNDTDKINVSPVGDMFAGQMDTKSISISWEASASKDSSWFKGYELTISSPLMTANIVKELDKNQTAYQVDNCDSSATYTFKIVAVGINPTDSEEVKSTPKSIQWALATHFTRNDVNAEIKVYVKESSIGSGLNLYEAENAPSTWKVTSGAKWNLALGSKSKLIFGTASKVVSEISYNLTGTPVDAEIYIPTFENDYNSLVGLLLNVDLSKFDYSKQYIDLTSSAATSKSKGFLFFAKINNHYAKIIILKKNGKYLQDDSSNDAYIQLLVSYQTRSGVPFAKPANK